MKIEAQIVNAFIDGNEGGNPAGVVLNADSLSPPQKLAIAAKIGLSETAFVSRSQSAAFKLEFFTPTRQIAHCGHATIATFCLLRQLGKVSSGLTSKETIDGNRDIIIDGDMAFMEQRAPRYVDLPSAGVTLENALLSLGITQTELISGAAPTIVDTGNSFLVVPLRNRAAVGNVTPDFAAIENISEQLDLIGYYVFSLETESGARDASARMFAPRYGIKEESATGMAAEPLACFLRDRLGVKKDVLLIEQGRLMVPPSPSAITVKLDVHDGAIRKLMAGGTARPVRSLALEI